jgi:hypothetical protein
MSATVAGERLRALLRERLERELLESYLGELEILTVSGERVVLAVGETLAREASRRCGATLAGACRELFGCRQVLLVGDGEWFDLGGGGASTKGPPVGSAGRAGRREASRGLRQRSGPCGQPGIRERLADQWTQSTPRRRRRGVRNRPPQAPGIIVVAIASTRYAGVRPATAARDRFWRSAAPKPARTSATAQSATPKRGDCRSAAGVPLRRQPPLQCTGAPPSSVGCACCEPMDAPRPQGRPVGSPQPRPRRELAAGTAPLPPEMTFRCRPG